MIRTEEVGHSPNCHTEPLGFMLLDMDTIRRDLMTRRDAALKTGDRATFHALTREIAALPLKGVPPLTAKDIARFDAAKRRAS